MGNYITARINNSVLCIFTIFYKCPSFANDIDSDNCANWMHTRSSLQNKTRAKSKPP